MKSSNNEMGPTIAIQKDIMERAASMGRKLEIFIGLPTDEKIEHFLAHPDWETTLSLNELEFAGVEQTKSAIWGPRWTLGFNTAEVEQLHAEGKRAITWTMDEGDYIKEYIENSEYDGMVTNYPTLVAFHHYTR